MEDETLELHFKTIDEKIGNMYKSNREEHNLIFSKLNALASDVTQLKVKSGAWGFIAGAIPASLTAVYFYIKSITNN